MAMEALTVMFKNGCNNGVFKGFQMSNEGPLISHLLFADDALLVGEWSVTNVQSLSRLLRVLKLVFGLNINLSKTTLFGVGVNFQNVKAMADIFHCKAGEVPFLYLGIKAVLECLPSYYFSLYQAPVKILEILEAKRRRFLWRGSEEKKKTCWVAWKRITSAKEDGGLGLCPLKDSNLAFLSKWWWRFKVEEDSLWKKVIMSIHHTPRSWPIISNNKRLNGTWDKIVKIEKSLTTYQVSLTDSIKGRVGNRSKVRFWLDIWLTEDRLKNQFPTLLSLEAKKSCVVADRCILTDGNYSIKWNWKSQPMYGVAVNELIEILDLLYYFRFKGGEDKWVWGGEALDSFSVATMKKLLYRVDTPCPNSILDWNSWVPMKVNAIVWRAIQNSLPTCDNLIKRKILFGPDICCNCLAAGESVDHIFVSCYVACVVWQRIGRWCNIHTSQIKDVQGLLVAVNQVPEVEHKRKVTYSIVMTAIWCLWETRNKFIFENKPVKIDKMLGDIKPLLPSWELPWIHIHQYERFSINKGYENHDRHIPRFGLGEVWQGWSSGYMKNEHNVIGPFVDHGIVVVRYRKDKYGNDICIHQELVWGNGMDDGME
ncbi:uncharacterized protein LOC143618241 [Bidens hawaiensis]|uniref:uncharacterized protein LOC143618241 n=1 Tax=Bidens hawaiensis TaxID=980011 RepID=UPI00404B557D